ncbi:Uncharacterized protein PBTT_07632 [Plasmodiophora brassicae]|uniref:Uncharacterized protein n=1 Tax=Plasmodiophora brassicae TaxID=37360 RepID=A0A3P3YG79_PLABS|nr:unnamed protein product [Plasmodiophora brassicae]
MPASVSAYYDLGIRRLQEAFRLAEDDMDVPNEDRLECFSREALHLAKADLTFVPPRSLDEKKALIGEGGTPPFETVTGNVAVGLRRKDEWEMERHYAASRSLFPLVSLQMRINLFVDGVRLKKLSEPLENDPELNLTINVYQRNADKVYELAKRLELGSVDEKGAKVLPDHPAMHLPLDIVYYGRQVPKHAAVHKRFTLDFKPLVHTMRRTIKAFRK